MYNEGLETHTNGDDPSLTSRDDFDPDFVELLQEDPSLTSLYDDDKVDLYAVLGVARDATEAEIRSAYRRLSKMLHPDKQVFRSDESNAAAQSVFTRLVNAYTILSNPNKRTIYDMHGHEGLAMEGLELATRDKSVAELRAQYLFARAQIREAKFETALQSTSQLAINLDISDLFDNYLQATPEEWATSGRTVRLPLRRVTMGHSFCAANSAKDQLYLNGQIITQQGLGFGLFGFSWMHKCSANSYLGYGTRTLWDMQFGKPISLLSTRFRLEKDIKSTVTLFAELPLDLRMPSHKELMLVPSPTFGFNIALKNNLLAKLDYRCFDEGGLNSSLTWIVHELNLSTTCKAFIRNTGDVGFGLHLTKVVSWSFLSPPLSTAAFRKKEPEKTIKPDWAEEEFDADENKMDKRGGISLGAEASTQEILSVNGELSCFITNHSRIGMKLTFGLISGVTFKFRLERGSHSFHVPLTLSHRPDPYAAAYGMVVPLVTFSLLRSLVYEPWLRNQLKQAEEHHRKKLMDELLRRRREAMVVQSLMEGMARRIRDKEMQINGLVIQEAIFGLLDAQDPFGQRNKDVGGLLWVEVTTPLQAAVIESHIRFPPSKFSDMHGFYDPCLGLYMDSRPGTDKSRRNGRHLAVRYIFQGKEHFVLVSENQGLAIPMAKHCVGASIQ